MMDFASKQVTTENPKGDRDMTGEVVPPVVSSAKYDQNMIKT